MSFLTKCPICGGDVDYDAIMCPHCGASRSSRRGFVGAGGSFSGGTLIVLVVIIYIIYMVYNTFPETFNHINRVENVWCGYFAASSTDSLLRVYKKDVKKKGSSICLREASLRGDEYFRLRQKSTKRIGDEKFEAGIYGDKIVIITGKPILSNKDDKRRYKIIVESIKEWDGSKQPTY